MLRSTAIAAVLTVGVTTVAAVDMISLFINSDGFGPETKTSVIAYNQDTDRNNASRPDGVQTTAATGNVAAKNDGLIIDATNYVDWKNVHLS